MLTMRLGAENAGVLTQEIPTMLLTISNQGPASTSIRVPRDFFHGEVVVRAKEQMLVLMHKQSLRALLSGVFFPPRQILLSGETITYEVRLLEDFVADTYAPSPNFLQLSEPEARESNLEKWARFGKLDSCEVYAIALDKELVSNVAVIRLQKRFAEKALSGGNSLK